MKRLIACVAMVVIVSGCASLNRLNIPFTADKAKAGIRLLLIREGYTTNNLTDAEISQVVDWIAEDWEQDQERQAFLDGVASRKANEDEILALAGKYFPGGEWNLPADPVAPDAGPHVVTKIATWYGGEDFSGAVVDSRFQLTVSGDGRIWSRSPSDWPIKSGGDLQVIVCAAYEKDGEWVGGKFEWNHSNPTPRNFGNIAEGYEGWVAPPDGTELTLCASIDGKRVSTEAKATYRSSE